MNMDYKLDEAPLQGSPTKKTPGKPGEPAVQQQAFRIKAPYVNEEEYIIECPEKPYFGFFPTKEVLQILI